MRIFVYGTLKEGCSANHLLREAEFIGEAATHPRYHIYDIEGFPGMVVGEDSDNGVHGEVYEVEERCVVEDLDEYEIEGSLFKREEIELNDGSKASAYLYLHDVFAEDIIQNGIWEERE
jgi:gamma-glutamylaminecyclotransferase